MKDIRLKYYLRGLGIGMAVTALVLSIAGNEATAMTDAQVRERAIELGMVDADSLVLSELRENETHERSDDASEEQTTKEPSEDGMEISEAEEVTEETVAEGTFLGEAVQSVTIEIQTGASSVTVSRELEAAGLISNAGEFDDYLCDNGYSRVLRVGTYEIPVGTKEEEIAKIITGKSQNPLP